MPAGHRGPKKPVLVQPRGKGQQPSERWGPFGGEDGGYIPEEVPGYFEAWEFRFWAMATFGNAMRVTECRACTHLGEDDMKVRRMHGKQGGCWKRLIEAYKLLLKDKRCVICDLRTDKVKWGIPVCSSACQQAWCETEATPRALQQALQLVGDLK